MTNINYISKNFFKKFNIKFKIYLIKIHFNFYSSFNGKNILIYQYKNLFKLLYLIKSCNHTQLLLNFKRNYNN